MTSAMDQIRRSYDLVAAQYFEKITPVDRKPFDCKQLDAFLHGLPHGEILDLGCGPGDVTRYLRKQREKVTGIDLSAEMVRRAKAVDPTGRYEVGDFTSLLPRQPLAGITAFYSLIHLDQDIVALALACWRAALMPGGRVLIAVHAGDASIHLNTFLDTDVDLTFHFFQAAEVRSQLANAGLEVDRLDQREPYPDIEAQTRRLYAHAHKPRDRATSD